METNENDNMTSKLLGYTTSGNNMEIYIITDLSQETTKIPNKQPYTTP